MSERTSVETNTHLGPHVPTQVQRTRVIRRRKRRRAPKLPHHVLRLLVHNHTRRPLSPVTKQQDHCLIEVRLRRREHQRIGQQQTPLLWRRQHVRPPTRLIRQRRGTLQRPSVLLRRRRVQKRILTLDQFRPKRPPILVPLLHRRQRHRIRHRMPPRTSARGSSPTNPSRQRLKTPPCELLHAIWRNQPIQLEHDSKTRRQTTDD